MRMKENKILFDGLVSVKIQNAELQIMKFTNTHITVRRSLHTQWGWRFLKQVEQMRYCPHAEVTVTSVVFHQ